MSPKIDYPTIEYEFISVTFATAKDVANAYGRVGWMFGGFQYVPEKGEILLCFWRATLKMPVGEKDEN